MGGFLAALLTPWFAKQVGWIGAFEVASLFAVAGAVVWTGVNPSLGNAIDVRETTCGPT